MSEEKSRMIPPFRTIIIGLKEPKERKVYPLSWSDMKKVQNLIFYCFSQVIESDLKDPVQIFNFVFSIIHENLVVLANLVVETDEEITDKNITAEQAIELADMICDMNFEGILKNLQSFQTKIGGLLKKAQVKMNR